MAGGAAGACNIRMACQFAVVARSQRIPQLSNLKYIAFRLV